MPPKKIDIEKEFGVNQDQLINIIESYVEGGMNYFEAIIHYCEKNDLEIEYLALVIPSSIRTKLGEDARRLKLLKPEFNNQSTLDV